MEETSGIKEQGGLFYTEDGKRLYRTKEAIDYIAQKYKLDSLLLENTFYRYVIRQGNYQKYDIPSLRGQKSRSQYLFTQEQLDQMEFRDIPASKKELPEPKQIFSLSELDELEEFYGELVDLEGLRRLIHEKTGVWYPPKSLKMRRRRGSLWAVAYTGNNRETLFYPTSQIETMRFHTGTALKARKRNGEGLA